MKKWKSTKENKYITRTRCYVGNGFALAYGLETLLATVSYRFVMLFSVLIAHSSCVPQKQNTSHRCSFRFSSKPRYKSKKRGACVAQSIEHPTLDFSSGHDLWVLGSSPTSGFMHSRESAGDSLSLSIFLYSLSLSLK